LPPCEIRDLLACDTLEDIRFVDEQCVCQRFYFTGWKGKRCAERSRSRGRGDRDIGFATGHLDTFRCRSSSSKPVSECFSAPAPRYTRKLAYFDRLSTPLGDRVRKNVSRSGLGIYRDAAAEHSATGAPHQILQSTIINHQSTITNHKSPIEISSPFHN
jgi:hypothetical protein